MDIKLIIGGGLTGFLSAAIVDINAWSKSTPKGEKNTAFDWGLAFRRWVAGAITGATTAAGWHVTVGA